MLSGFEIFTFFVSDHRKPWLHVGRFYLHCNTTLLSEAAGTVKPECCTCSQGHVLQQNRWDNVAEYSSN